MKKLLYLVVMLTIVSCNTEKQIGDGIDYEIYEVDFENHTYILFQNPDGDMSAIHSPNCTHNVESVEE